MDDDDVRLYDILCTNRYDVWSPFVTWDEKDLGHWQRRRFRFFSYCQILLIDHLQYQFNRAINNNSNRSIGIIWWWRRLPRKRKKRNFRTKVSFDARNSETIVNGRVVSSWHGMCLSLFIARTHIISFSFIHSFISDSMPQIIGRNQFDWWFTGELPCVQCHCGVDETKNSSTTTYGSICRYACRCCGGSETRQSRRAWYVFVCWRSVRTCALSIILWKRVVSFFLHSFSFSF